MRLQEYNITTPAANLPISLIAMDPIVQKQWENLRKNLWWRMKDGSQFATVAKRETLPCVMELIPNPDLELKF